MFQDSVCIQAVSELSYGSVFLSLSSDAQCL